MTGLRGMTPEQAYEQGYRDGASNLIADIIVKFDPEDGVQSMDDLLAFFRTIVRDPDLEWPGSTS